MRNYPKIPPKPVTETYFGTEVTDPYRYLEDKDNPETKAAVAEENAYTKRWFDSQPVFSAKTREAELRKQIAAKPKELRNMQDACGFICASRSTADGTYEIVTLDDRMNVTGVVLTDAMLDNRMHIYSAEPCPVKAGLFAVLAVIHGHPRCCIVVWDAREGKALAELDGTFGYTWSLDGSAILYSDAELDTAHDRNINRVRRYDWQSDTLTTLYTHEENAVFIQTAPTKSGCFYQVMNTYDDILMLYRDDDTGGITKLNDGIGSCTYVGSGRGAYYFKTNRDAPFSRIVAITEAQLTEEQSLQTGYTIALPEQEYLLGAAGVTADGLLALHEKDACSVLSLYDFTGQKLQDIPLPDRFGHAEGDEYLRVSDAHHVYFSFQSFTMQPSVMVYDAKTHELSHFVKKREDAADVTVEPHFVTARDGQRILVYLVRPKNLTPCGDTPVLMYGYGGYAVSNTPWPEDMVTGHNILEWVRKGRIYAHCVIRGGSEYGTAWHEAAMKDSKKHAFTDYIDIARYLVADGWTKPAKIVATGLSNGGLLMTAVTTMAPDAFGCVIASVPHTDMLRFRQDDRGMMYITEYGDPQESEAMFRYMYSYSPYHNIHQGVTYPSIYVQTGEMDNNVPPYHGKKFAIRLQAEASEDNPVLLQVLAHGSHNRGVGDEYYRNIAQMQTFVEIQLAEKE